MAEWLDVLDPVGEPADKRLVPAPRLPNLAGKAIGYIDNNKWNVEPLLQAIHAQLQERYGAGPMVYRRKRLFSRPAPPEVYDALAREAAAVVIAIGD